MKAELLAPYMNANLLIQYHESMITTFSIFINDYLTENKDKLDGEITAEIVKQTYETQSAIDFHQAAIKYLKTHALLNNEEK